MDKPPGPTSHDVVARVRRALRIRAVGHTGTLDPFASGLLVVLLGRATRLARFIEAEPKTYVGVARLGVRTDTDDRTGTPLERLGDPAALREPEIRAALESLAGRQRQRPPPFSAKRVAGERSYRLARRGQPPELAEVPVEVHGIELLEWRPPEVGFRATVSAGTYVRALARDLGERLGVGAHLAELRREAIGPLRVEAAVPLAALGPATQVLPPHAVLPALPAVSLDDAGRAAVIHGRPVELGDLPVAGTEGVDEAGFVALMAAGQLVAVARLEGGWLRPVVVLEAA